MDKEYVLSGRFIHDELASRCLAAVNKLYDLWRTDKRIMPTLLLWPTDSVRATDGSRFSGVVFTALSENKTERTSEIRNAVTQCNAYGLMLTEQLEETVRVIFETQHGTRTWRLPIKNHGDVQILGRPSVSDNTEAIGVLWAAN